MKLFPSYKSPHIPFLGVEAVANGQISLKNLYQSPYAPIYRYRSCYDRANGLWGENSFNSVVYAVGDGS